MLTFVSVILIGTFTSLPIPDETSRFWDLLEIGLGGYVAEAIFKIKGKN